MTSINLLKNGGQIYLFSDQLIPIPAKEARHVRPPVNSQHLEVIREQALIHTEKGHIEIIGKGDIENQKILYARVMENGQLLLIVKNMGLVSESAKMFYNFMLRTSIFVYLIGIMISFIIAKGVSKPIIRMKEVTHKMADLTFDEKLIVKKF